MRERAVHHLRNIRVLAGAPGNLGGASWCAARPHPDLQMWQRVDFLTECESLECSVFYALECPIPICGQTIELDRNEIRRQMVEFASYVPEEIEEALVEASACSGY